MKILVCTDGSETAEKAVKAGAISANNFGFEVTVLNVIQDSASYDKFPTDPGFLLRKEKAENILSRAKKIVEEVSKDIKYGLQLAHGPVVSHIIRIAEDGKYDGIFIGTTGTTGVKRVLLGSVADEVLRHAHCPVTLIR